MDYPFLNVKNNRFKFFIVPYVIIGKLLLQVFLYNCSRLNTFVTMLLYRVQNFMNIKITPYNFNISKTNGVNIKNQNSYTKTKRVTQ